MKFPGTAAKNIDRPGRPAAGCRRRKNRTISGWTTRPFQDKADIDPANVHRRAGETGPPEARSPRHAPRTNRDSLRPRRHGLATGPHDSQHASNNRQQPVHQPVGFLTLDGNFRQVCRYQNQSSLALQLRLTLGCHPLGLHRRHSPFCLLQCLLRQATLLVSRPPPGTANRSGQRGIQRDYCYRTRDLTNCNRESTAWWEIT